MMTCIAVDDESLALDILEDNISKIPTLKLLKRCSNALEANDFLQQQLVDLVFLDIQMPGISGVQFLRSLHKKPLVIFITAYEQYAVDGFDLDVVDYLLKPVSFERFLKAINKAQEKFSRQDVSPAAQAGEVPTHLFVNSEYSVVRIDLDDIVYIEGLKDYIKIYLHSSKRAVITRLGMKAIEDKLPPNKFVRVQKSFIVALNKIISIRKGRITMKDKEQIIPVGENFKENLDKLINPTGS